MYCSSCGNEIPNGTKFCAACGAEQTVAQPVAASVPTQEQQGYAANPYQQQPPAQPQQSYSQPQYQQPQQGYAAQPQQPYAQQYSPAYGLQQPPKNQKKKATAIIISAVVVVALVIAAIFIFGGSGGASSPDKLVASYFKAYEKADLSAMMKLYHDKYVKAGRTYGGLSTDADFLYDVDDWFSEYGTRVINYKITDTDFDDIGASEKASMAAILGISASKLGSMATVSVEVELQGYSYTRTYDFDILEIGGKWYLIEVW